MFDSVARACWACRCARLYACVRCICNGPMLQIVVVIVGAAEDDGWSKLSLLAIFALARLQCRQRLGFQRARVRVAMVETRSQVAKREKRSVNSEGGGSTKRELSTLSKTDLDIFLKKSKQPRLDDKGMMMPETPPSGLLHPVGMTPEPVQANDTMIDSPGMSQFLADMDAESGAHLQRLDVYKFALFICASLGSVVLLVEC